MNAGNKVKNVYTQHQEQSLSTSLYSFVELDESIAAQNQKLNPKFSESSSAIFQQPEEHELSKVSRIISRLKTQQQLNQLLSIFAITQFSSVRLKINSFFLNLFLQSRERDSILIPFETILLEFHNFFPYFDEEDQVELLEALSAILLQISPSESNTKGNADSNLQLYKTTVECYTLVLQECIRIDFALDLTITFINSILQNALKIASNISQITKNLINKADYICDLLPFIAEMETFMEKNDQYLNRLIQQFFITCILFTLDDLTYIRKWDSSLDKIARFLPPLIQRKPKIDFSSTKVRIVELLTLYNVEKYKKPENVISVFSKILPGLPTKKFQQMDCSDVIYALSIYFLEKVRAERGIFGQILEYFEVRYIYHFTGILTSMVDPLLSDFYNYLENLTDMERKDMCVSFTMCELVHQFASVNQRVQIKVDPILKDLANKFPTVICNIDVLNEISATFYELNKNGDQQRILIFNEIIDKLFETAFSDVPNSFYSAIFHSQIKNYNSFQIGSNSSPSLFPILQRLPSNVNENIMQKMMLVSAIHGQAKFANEELIRSVQNEQERFLLSASYFLINPYSDIVYDLMTYNDPKVLLSAWTHISMESVEMSKLIIPLLIQTFIDLSKDNEGIFGPKKKSQTEIEGENSEGSENKNSKNKVDNDYSDGKSSNSQDDDDSDENSSKNEDKDNNDSDEESNESKSVNENENTFSTSQLEVDDKIIQLQTTLLQFFIENITLNRHYADYASVLMCAIDKTFVPHSSIVPAVISYAYLGCLVMKIPYQLSARCYDNLRKIILKLSLISYSFTYDDYLLRYITERELFLLQQLISCLPDVLSNYTKIDLPPKEPKSKSKSKSKSNSKDKDNSSDQVNLNNLIREVEDNYQQDNNQKNDDFISTVKAVSFLLCDEVQIFNAFINQNQTSPSLQKVLTARQLKETDLSIPNIVKDIWDIAPEALYPFCKMPNLGQNVIKSIMKLMNEDHFTAPSVSMLSPLYALSAKANLNYLRMWKIIPGNKALSLLTPALMKNTVSASYVARCFETFTKRESLLFLPQLVQSLRFDKSEVLRHFLIRYCKQSEVFSHYLLWNILAEKNNPIGSNDNLPKILKDLERTIIENMNEKEKTDYENEFGLIDKLDEVSQKLLPMEIDQRPPAFVDMLNELEIPEGLYIPSNPNYKILSINSTLSVPLKSHARVPILVHFNVYDEEDKEKKPIPFSCIFKIHDDVRQDAMMIQFIDMTKQILTDAGIDHYLFPYRVFATGENRGVIECIHNAKSRHDIGVTTNEFLLEYFINKYGQVGTPNFQRAQDNFIKSVAPYSLICYLFQVKDRHNANIMIDDDGHVLHIDFGFIFEISPGGNLKFEKAPFKLTKEMIDLLGGSKEAPAFLKFVDLLIKCFLAVRARHEELESITSLMMNAGFPCFLPDSIKKLQARLFIDKSPKETTAEIMKLIDDAYDSGFTTLYDRFQKLQNNIWY